MFGSGGAVLDENKKTKMVNGDAKLKISTSTQTDCGPHRIQSRTVSFNANGSHLAIGTSTSAIHIWDTTKEVSILAGHSLPVTKVRYHSSDISTFLSASKDLSVRQWDVRTRSATGKVETAAYPVSIEWNREQSNIFLISERSGLISIHDNRKLTIGAGAKGASAASVIYSREMKPNIPRSCIFNPTGEHIVAGTTSMSVEGMADIMIWRWETQNDESSKAFSYPANFGLIFTMAFSKDGRRLVTGGDDAMVGLWDTKSMCCTHSMSKHARYVLSADFSPDSKFFATATEEESILLSNAITAEEVGEVQLGNRPRAGGAAEVAFHPTAHYLLACANTGATLPSAATLVKLKA